MKPEPQERDFAQNYESLNYGRSLASSMLRRGHAAAEQPFAGRHFSQVLEVGSGSGEHFTFVQHSFDRYTMSDLQPEMITRALPSKVTVERQDAAALSYPDERFDRLIAAHVLEHLKEPHRVLREWNRVVKPGGTLTLLQPCDPGLLWRAGRWLGPRRRAEAAGLAYDFVMAREHINAITNLRALVRYYFEQVDERWYPLRVPLSDLNLFYICHITR
jgi:ubiquinone/menaquinone biosynthesis C-methylase UbiE